MILFVLYKRNQQLMQPEQLILPAKIPQKYTQQKLKSNKKQLVKILQSAPIAGVYLGQDQGNWDHFFDEYIKFLKSQIGPRGQCSKQVRVELSKNSDYFDEVLSLLKVNHKTHIKDIYVKYKCYSPCKQYDDLVKAQQALEKSEASFKNIMDQTSIMYATIKQGMLAKRGPQYDYVSEIKTIREKYKQKNLSITNTIKELHQFLDLNQNYIRYTKLKAVMKPYFTKWRQADMRVGMESGEKGDTFQKIVQQQLLPYILQKAKIDPHCQYRMQKNCRWQPRALGEIDIAIILKNEVTHEWEASILIQCKSRLFDIREAFKQVTQLKDKGKQKLCTSFGIIGVSANPQYFIVTTLPQNPFVLPIQSKMKQTLQKATKNIPTDEIKSQKVFPFAKQVFKNELSPLEWFLQNDSDRIIVLNY